MVGAILALLVLVGAGGAVMLMQMQNLSQGSTDEPVEIVPVGHIQMKASEYRKSGDIDGGLKFFDDQIAGRDSDEEKQEILLYKSQFASDSGRADEAVKSAEQANSIEPTFASMIDLARAYEAQGNNAKAVEYYSKALDISKASGGSPRTDGMWEAKIKELSQ